MGLAAPRKRRKISNDPNNTTWSQNGAGFGHKMLAAQGWTPGSYLGANDAAQAEYYSSANSSHIRVILKDDNLGLGAKPGKSEAGAFGLGALQDIYGRLNGKSEVIIAKEQEHRADLGRKLYAEQKWGTARFVRGGYLVGDRIEESSSVSTEDQPPEKAQQDGGIIGPNQHEQEEAKAPQDRLNRPNGLTAKLIQKETNGSNIDSNPRNKDKFMSRASRKEDREVRRKRKEERRERKLGRAARRAARAVKNASVSIASEPDDAPVVSDSTQSGGIKSVASNNKDSVSDAPRVQQILPISGLNAVRQRFIRQKRLASRDPVALREVLNPLFLIKQEQC